MNKKFKITLVLVLILVFSYFLGFNVGYYIYNFTRDEIVQNTQNNLKSNNKDEELIEVSSNNHTVKDNTILVYEYLDTENNYIKVLEDLPPYYLIGLERGEVEKIFSDWSLVSFSSDKIILQKCIEDEQTYFLSSYNGKIAIFSKDDRNEENLIEVLNKPIVSLPYEEQEKIAKGIYINSKLELINYIQDYES